ncbi:MAG: DUF421 domain-containing protein [Actinomycetota bacterium]
MDAVLRATLVYGFLFVVMRVSGKRTLAQVTPFDFVLLLIIGEATQQGLIGDDFSTTKALLLIVTLVGIDIGISLVKRIWPRFALAIEGAPLVLIKDGEPIDDRLKRTRLDLGDVLESARSTQGLERLDQIKYAVLERDGSISIIPG